jgi:hypothetical protein
MPVVAYLLRTLIASIVQVPFVLAAIISLGIDFSLMRLISFFIIVLSSMMINNISARSYEVKLYDNLINGFLIPFSRCTFEKVDPEQITSAAVLQNANYHGFETKNLSNLYYRDFPEIFYVKRKNANDEYPSSFSSYPLMLDTPYIFVNTDLSRMNSWQKFCFHHELGHISLQHANVLLSHRFRVIHLIVFALIAAIYTDGSPLYLSIISINFLLCILYFFYFENSSHRSNLCEISADKFALSHLNKFDIETVSRLYPKFLERLKLPKKDYDLRLSMFDNSISDPNQNDNDFEYALGKYTLELLGIQVAQDWLPQIVTFIIAVFLGFNLKEPEIPELLSIIFMVLFIPFIIYSRFLLMCDSLRKKVQALIRKDLTIA